MGMLPTLSLALALAILYGCATSIRSSSTTRATEPDCSFRAASSCWTLAARFPPSRAETDSQPGEIVKPPPAVLAGMADSTRLSR
jgi:hypothetical protein